MAKQNQYERASVVKEKQEESKESAPPANDGFAASSPVSSNAVGLYFNEISRVPLLTPEEEIKLAKQMEKGKAAQQKLSQNDPAPQETSALQSLVAQGEEARQQLIKANTRLVVSIAKRYRGYGIPFQDLIQAGNVGLITGIDKFDYQQGNKVSTYVSWWIRQSIVRSLNQHGRLIRIPGNLNARIRRLRKTGQKLRQELGRQPTPTEIAEKMGLRTHKVRRLLQISRRPLSLNRPVGEEGDSELASFIEDQKTPSPSESVERQLLREDLMAIMSETLSEREIRVLCMRQGMQGYRTHTLREVAEELGVSRERVRQIERKAMRKLRRPYHRHKLLNYLR